MAIVTLDGHVARATDFFNRNDVYIAIGHKEEWEDEANPPLPQLDDEIEDIIAIKRVESKSFVVEDPEGDLLHLGKHYKIVQPEQAFEKGARWIYCVAWLEYGECPTEVAYRQVAIQTMVETLGGLPEGQYVFTPEQIVNNGITEILDNIQPIYRRPDKKEKLAVIAEF